MTLTRVRFQFPLYVISALIFICLGAQGIFAAGLDDLYLPFPHKGKYLYQAELTRYDMTEDGVHASTSFSDFESDPNIWSLYQKLRFSPLTAFEIEMGYGQYLPTDYFRRTNDGPTLALDTVQEYNLTYFQDYSLKMRYRRGDYESFVRFQEKRQKSKADAQLLLDNTISFDTIRSHYEDAAVGVRYLSQGPSAQGNTQDRILDRKLLSDHQVNVEVNVGFKNGRLKNISDVFVTSSFYLTYAHQLRPHYIPSVLVRYGLNDRLELASGVIYTTPFKYNYEFRQVHATLPNLINGTYSIENNITLPLQLKYRPLDHVLISFSSDINYIRQRLDAWEKENDNSITSYAVRKLKYYNTKPTLNVTYLSEADRPPQEDEISYLVKPMLGENQFKFNFKYQHDISTLQKADGNGAQNVIDPYSVFQFPLDLFVSGSEYGSFFLGNKTTRAAEVQPQNYFLLEGSVLYGLNDRFNMGVGVGYRSRNSLHHFTVHDLAERLYLFEAYNYYNFVVDMKIKKNSLLTLNVHYVPQYKTFLDTSVATHTKQFQVETNYVEASLGWKILF